MHQKVGGKMLGFSCLQIDKDAWIVQQGHGMQECLA